MGGKLGQALVRGGFVTAGQISVALDRQRSSRAPLAQLIVELGYVSPTAMEAVVARMM